MCLTTSIDAERKTVVRVLLLRVSRMAKNQLRFQIKLALLHYFSAFDASIGYYWIVHICFVRSTDRWPCKREK